MKDSDSNCPTERVSDSQQSRYRELASGVRDLIPTMGTPELREELRLLALKYDRLAEGVEALTHMLPTAPWRPLTD